MESQATVLIVDDEINLRRVLSAMLKKEGFKTILAADGAEAMAVLKLHEVSVVVTDLKMPRVDGMALLSHILEYYPDIPVIIITAHGTVDTAVHALKSGAFDYITKPFEQSEMKSIVRKAANQRTLNRRGAKKQKTEELKGKFGIIGQSKAMKQIFSVIERVANTPTTVLIRGESGTGKELIAKALHSESNRKNKPFIKINCAAIPRDLIESELFGYEKGAFTGAHNSKPGRFELANEGTLFLDEIGDIPVEMQVKLLRAIQEYEFERVGGIKTIRVDLKLITATNRDLQKEIELGNFREDLYYRLAVVPIVLPPLRDRAEDIPLLVEYFLKRYNDRLHMNVKGVDEEAIKILQGYPWPGNIRELENVIERTVLFLDEDCLTKESLPPEICSRQENLVPIPPIHLPSGESGLKDVVKETTSRLEKEYITKALQETRGNVTQAARLLKISRKSLQNKMKEFGLRDQT